MVVKRLAAVALVLAGALLVGARDPEVRLNGRWETSLEAARLRARAEGKPILLLHLFGRLDERWC